MNICHFLQFEMGLLNAELLEHDRNGWRPVEGLRMDQETWKYHETGRSGLPSL